MATFTGDNNDDFLTGEASDDTLNGLGGNDTLDGGDGIDTLNGGNGADLIHVGTGDTGNGGAGNDTLLASGRFPAAFNGGADFDILVGTADITSATLSGIEQYNADGGSLTAAQLDSFALVAGATATSGASFLTLTHGGTADVDLVGALNECNITGSAEADIITFSATDTARLFLSMGAGNDRIIGGAGGDTIDGEAGNDTLTGGDGNDSLDGGEGIDVLNGGTAGDILTGGAGADRLNGGSGSDRFDFNQERGSFVGTTDVVVAFEGAGAATGDLIDLSGIDASSVVAGNQSFVFNSVAAGGLSLVASGSDTLVRGNTDADAEFEFTLLITDGAVSDSAYTAADFIL